MYDYVIIAFLADQRTLISETLFLRVVTRQGIVPCLGSHFFKRARTGCAMSREFMGTMHRTILVEQ